MSGKRLFKLGTLAAGALLVASCSKNGNLLEGSDSLSLDGLGKLTRFSSHPGEMFTTQAPHNQVYLFDFDSNHVHSKYMDSINAQARYLKSHPSARIMLAGHTDDRGSREYNVALGERRARAVEHVMRMSGVDRQQMRVVSYGKEKPVNPAHTEEARAENRRVEMTFEAK